MPAPAFAPAPRRRDTRAHGRAQRRARRRAAGRARPGACAASRVRPRDRGRRRPAARRVRRGRHRDRPRSDIPADLGRVARPVGAPDRPCHPGRGAVRRARPAASDRRGRRQQHGAGGARHRRPAGRRPGHRACAGGAEVRGREATVPRARRAGAHRRRDLAVDRTGLRRCRASVAAESRRHPDPARSGAARRCAPPIRSGS